MPILAPDFSGLYFFDVRGLSLARPGLDIFPELTNVTGTTGAGIAISGSSNTYTITASSTTTTCDHSSGTCS